jgi:dTDP-4-amino-4,6-dideoxy-D-galactose acyltransferase
MKSYPELCSYLEWDSSFFSRRIGRINLTRLSQSDWQAVEQWSQANSIDCLYFQADPAHPPTIRLAEKKGFHLAEVRLVLERRLDDWQSQPLPRQHGEILIRQAQAQDLEALQALTRASYTTTHFATDPCFPDALVQEFYATWVKNSLLEGFDDIVLSAEHHHEPIAFISARFERNQHGIDRTQGSLRLIGVKPNLRHHGLGQTLLCSAIDWMVDHGVKHVTAVIQLPNLPIQRILQRQEFLLTSTSLYYHKWFAHCPEHLDP